MARVRTGKSSGKRGGAGTGKGARQGGGPGREPSAGSGSGIGSGFGSSGGGGQRQMTVRLKSARRRTTSQQRWLERQLNDPYVAAAKTAGLRSRAAFKLTEIDDKFGILKPGQRVVDLGAAPGGWTQIAVDRVQAPGRGQVIAIDILEMENLAGATVLHLDFLAEEAPVRLKALLRDGFADIVLSDMAAPTTGHTGTDHLRIMSLAEAAGQFACEVLEPGGTFLCKVFQGGTERELLDVLKRSFRSVRHVKPPASRKESSELYVLATGFRAQAMAGGEAG